MWCDAVATGTCPGGNVFTETQANSYPAHLVIYNDQVYWIAEQGDTRLIQTCSRFGCNGDPKAVFTSTVGSPLHKAPISGLAINGTQAFVGLYTGGIYRFTLTDPNTADVASLTQLQPSGYGTSELDLDGTTVRWAASIDGKVLECPTGACMNPSVFISGRQTPVSIRATATDVYGLDRGVAKQGGGYLPKTGALWHVKK